MKQKTKIILLIVGLVVIIGGGVLAYDLLSREYAHGAEASPVPPAEAPAIESPSAEPGAEVHSPEPDAGAAETPSAEPEATEAPRIPMLDFSMLDADCSTVQLADFTGKPIVLNFWASWCGPCKMEMPYFDAVYAEYGEDIHFVMLNQTDGTSETIESAKEFISASGYSFPVYFDTEFEGTMAYGVYSIPLTLFIDADGYILRGYVGAMSEETLISEVTALLGEN